MNVMSLGVAALFGLLLIFICVLLKHTIMTGKKAGMKGMHLARHVQAKRNFLFSLVAAVGLIEVLLIFNGRGWGDPMLLGWHWCFDLYLALSLIGMNIWTGEKSRDMHITIFSLVLVSFVGATVTGVMLLTQAPLWNTGIHLK
jgi:hypothetical protein